MPEIHGRREMKEHRERGDRAATGKQGRFFLSKERFLARRELYGHGWRLASARIFNGHCKALRGDAG